MSEPDPSLPLDSFPEILGTGSMLKLATEGGMGVVYLADLRGRAEFVTIAKAARRRAL